MSQFIVAMSALSEYMTMTLDMKDIGKLGQTETWLIGLNPTVRKEVIDRLRSLCYRMETADEMRERSRQVGESLMTIEHDATKYVGG